MDRLDDFDEQEEMGEQAPSHIWLRYATQFTAGERTYTIDIGIPVPLGADARTREQLLREADTGLDQLANYVERRVMQVAQQSTVHPSSPARSASPAIPAPTPAAAPTPISLPVSTPAVPSATTSNTGGNTGSAGKPQTPAASASPAREETTASSSPSTPAPQAAPRKQPTTPAAAPTPVPPSRPGIGASMPPSPGLPTGTLPLPEFLKYLKEMGLDARRAMTMLQVKSLSGLNLREALEQLQHMLIQEGGNPATPGGTPAAQPAAQAARIPTGPQAPVPNQSPPSRSGAGAGESRSASNPASPAVSSQAKVGANRPAAPSAAPSMPTPVSTLATNRQGNPAPPTTVPPANPANRPPTNPAPTARPVSTPAAANATKRADGGPQPLVLQEGKPPYPVVFDEEEDEAELEDLDFDEDEEEMASSFGTGVGLSATDRGSAEDIVSRLREAGGSAAVGPTRLKVLHNIIDGQLTPQQLQALIRGVWGAASDKKLKSDQAEALISWGKQDDFVTEAEMVLALFEEDGGASSNR